MAAKPSPVSQSSSNASEIMLVFCESYEDICNKCLVSEFNIFHVQITKALWTWSPCTIPLITRSQLSCQQNTKHGVKRGNWQTLQSPVLSDESLEIYSNSHFPSLYKGRGGKRFYGNYFTFLELKTHTVLKICLYTNLIFFSNSTPWAYFYAVSLFIKPLVVVVVVF